MHAIPVPALFNRAPAHYDHSQDMRAASTGLLSDYAEAISTAPNLEQMADALASLGTTKQGLRALQLAWMGSREAFLQEVLTQMGSAFNDMAETALECDAHEVLGDWA